MGACSKGLEYMLLPRDEKPNGHMGSSGRRRQAVLCYRLVVLVMFLGLVILGISWYKLSRTTPKKKIHDQIQQQLTINTNKEWMKNFQENKDDDWDWDQYGDNDYSGFTADEDDDDDVVNSSKDGVLGIPARSGDANDNDYAQYYSQDYGAHDPQGEEPWSLDEDADRNIDMMVRVIPEEAFRQNYKNPCWTESLDFNNPYEGNFYIKENPKLKDYFEKLYKKIGDRHWRMRCLPYFYIFDGPEAESEEKDNFYKVLQFHPYIAKPSVHRAQFWNIKRLENQTRFRDYVDLFDQSAADIRADMLKMDNADVKLAHAKVVGDDSGSYLYNFDNWKLAPVNDVIPDDLTAEQQPQFIAADFIASQTPDARFLVIIRNPIKRLAEYYYKVLQPGATVQDFHTAVLQSTTLFNQCVMGDDQNIRKCAYNKTLNQKMKLPLRIALYWVFIADWKLRFQDEQFKFIIYEEFRRQPVNTLNSAYKFLGLANLPPEEFNDVKKHWSNVQENKTLIWPMLDNTRKLLKGFFAPHNKHLAELIHKPELVMTWDTASNPEVLQAMNKVFKKLDLEKIKIRVGNKFLGKIAPTTRVQPTTRVPSMQVTTQAAVRSAVPQQVNNAPRYSSTDQQARPAVPQQAGRYSSTDQQARPSVPQQPSGRYSSTDQQARPAAPQENIQRPAVIESNNQRLPVQQPRGEQTYVAQRTGQSVQQPQENVRKEYPERFPAAPAPQPQYPARAASNNPVYPNRPQIQPSQDGQKPYNSPQTDVRANSEYNAPLRVDNVKKTVQGFEQKNDGYPSENKNYVPPVKEAYRPPVQIQRPAV